MKIIPVVLVILQAGVAIAQKAPHADEIADFVKWAHVTKVDSDAGRSDRDVIRACGEAYDGAIAAGVPPTEPINADDLDGTMAEIKKNVCDAAKATLDNKDEKRTGPYKKVLKNGKWDIWKDYAAALILPHRADAGDPGKLAASLVWYVDTSPSERCSNGSQKHRVHRYQFDKSQKLVKTTDKDYCGEPPSSAFP